MISFIRLRILLRNASSPPRSFATQSLNSAFNAEFCPVELVVAVFAFLTDCIARNRFLDKPSVSGLGVVHDAIANLFAKAFAQIARQCKPRTSEGVLVNLFPSRFGAALPFLKLHRASITIKSRARIANPECGTLRSSSTTSSHLPLMRSSTMLMAVSQSSQPSKASSQSFSV